LRFHHVGYAVADIHAYLRDFLMPLFEPLSISEPVPDPIQHVTVCFVTMQGGTVIELVEPLGDKSPVSGIVGSSRGGVYHLCYEVEDLEEQVKRFRLKGCLPLGRPVPAAAFGGRRIVFLMTPQRDLIEFVEAAQTVHRGGPDEVSDRTT
jgi:methylmalonyl-CoA/ethylmalonyl-CoA epimerase